MDVDASRPSTPTTTNKGETKHVHFSEVIQETLLSPRTDDEITNNHTVAPSTETSKSVTETDKGPDSASKYDADDDGDASDVEDYNDTADQKSDEEFEAPEPEADDETTIAQEESLPRDMNPEDELALLKQEGDLPLDELRKLYAIPDTTTAATPTNKASDDDDDDENAEEYEFKESEAVDDETTIEAEEKLGRDMSYEDEIALLKQESEMSIEELRAKYANLPSDTETNSVDSQEDSVDDVDDAASEDFEPNEEDCIDDETTMEAEERLGRDISYDEEMAILKRESEMSLEELRAMYYPHENQDDNQEEEEDADNDNDEEDEGSAMSNNETPTSVVNGLFGKDVDNDDDDEFAPHDNDAVDDETTIEAEERLGRDMSYEDEIALLKQESEMPVEELRKMYQEMSDKQDSVASSSIEPDNSTISSSAVTKRPLEESDQDGSKKQKVEETEDSAEAGLAALNALEASAERAKGTLASRPFLLSGWVKLRLYQQVGLNWLVSLQSRRLNGILADGELHFLE
jgi:hypothetical protein